MTLGERRHGERQKYLAYESIQYMDVMMEAT